VPVFFKPACLPARLPRSGSSEMQPNNYFYFSVCKKAKTRQQTLTESVRFENEQKKGLLLAYVFRL
jgi:hypothetical protein